MAEKTADISHTLSVGMALLMDTVRYLSAFTESLESQPVQAAWLFTFHLSVGHLAWLAWCTSHCGLLPQPRAGRCCRSLPPMSAMLICVTCKNYTLLRGNTSIETPARSSLHKIGVAGGKRGGRALSDLS